MTLSASVIICTHNPRADYLTRVLNALRDQTLSLDMWELLVIDNASKEQVAVRFDVSWHPYSRHIREEELGLTPARLRGISEAKAELLVFVDDDNVLDPNYLEQTTRIGREYPFLGSWGGSAVPEFEVPPEPCISPYLPCLALREVNRDCWANLATLNESVPNGAGLCVRQVVATAYASGLAKNSIRRILDRRGSDLSGGGDHDLVYTGCDIGLGSGTFKVLRLTHLIPSFRLTQSYILQLMSRMEYSIVLFNYSRTGIIPPRIKVSWWRRRARRFLLYWRPIFERRMGNARLAGYEAGVARLMDGILSPSPQ